MSEFLPRMKIVVLGCQPKSERTVSKELRDCITSLVLELKKIVD